MGRGARFELDCAGAGLARGLIQDGQRGGCRAGGGAPGGCPAGPQKPLLPAPLELRGVKAHSSECLVSKHPTGAQGARPTHQAPCQPGVATEFSRAAKTAGDPGSFQELHSGRQLPGQGTPSAHSWTMPPASPPGAAPRSELRSWSLPGLRADPSHGRPRAPGGEAGCCTFWLRLCGCLMSPRFLPLVG